MSQWVVVSEYDSGGPSSPTETSCDWFDSYEEAKKHSETGGGETVCIAEVHVPEPEKDFGFIAVEKLGDGDYSVDSGFTVEIVKSINPYHDYIAKVIERR